MERGGFSLALKVTGRCGKVNDLNSLGGSGFNDVEEFKGVHRGSKEWEWMLDGRRLREASTRRRATVKESTSERVSLERARTVTRSMVKVN